MNTPVLETQRLLLRPFRLDDAQAVLMDGKVTRMLPDICSGRTIMI